MKHVLLGLAACSLSLSTLGQEVPFSCGTDHEHERLMSDPAYATHYHALQNEIREILASGNAERGGDGSYVIPVVFHVLHMNGAENISNEQILDAMRILNEDFNKLNSDTIVHPAFRDIIGNARISFKLATKDPLGNCTNGIERIRTSQTLWGGANSKFNPWPRRMYLNIWVNRTMGALSSAAGYFTGAPSAADGIMILHSYTGSIGTSNPGSSRALTHEVGHYLSIPHVWGGNNDPMLVCGDDGIHDTPITKGWNHCPEVKNRAQCDRQPFVDVVYGFNNVTTSSGTTDPTPVPSALDTLTGALRTEFAPFTAVGVSANSAASGRFAFTDWNTGAADGETDYANLDPNVPTGKYYQFTLTPAVTHLATASSLVFKVARNATGIRTFAVRSNVGNFSSNLAVTVNDPAVSVQSGNVVFFNNDEAGEVTVTVTLPVNDSYNNVSSPITFRFYGWNAEDASGTFELDDVTVNGVSGTVENVENYMDYSYCSYAHMYTLGQVGQMHAMLNAAISERNNLWTEENLILTGVAEGHEGVCSPLADFYAVVGNLSNPAIPFSPTACVNTDVRFVDNSSRAFPTSWQWTFQDGVPATSTERNPTVRFTSGGWKTVTLTVSNDHGSDTKTNEYAVLIGQPDVVVGGQYHESFEAPEAIWPYFNMSYGPEGDVTHFSKYVGGGHTGNQCAWLNSGARNPLDFVNPTNDMDYDELITPNFDLSQMLNAQISFWYSYSANTNNLDTLTERLEVYSSNNCGATWQVRGWITAPQLLTNGTLTSGGPGNWVQRSFNIPSAMLTPNTRFRFRFISSHFSNHLFIDDINISGSVGIEDMTADNPLNVFPNPSNDQFTVQAYGMDRVATTLIITDLRGAEVYRTVQAPVGGLGITISAAELGMAEGLYLLRASNEYGTSTQKLVVGR